MPSDLYAPSSCTRTLQVRLEISSLLVWILPVTSCETMSRSGWARGSSSHRVGAGMDLCFQARSGIPQGLHREASRDCFGVGRTRRWSPKGGASALPPLFNCSTVSVLYTGLLLMINFRKGFCCLKKQSLVPPVLKSPADLCVSGPKEGWGYSLVERK